ncbi:MAG: hypothetical protein GOU99_01690 [Candidatus Altiarchaeota archaeon]|nr:hypothetical protein [Candidatus Altiarchaeota archaeon]
MKGASMIIETILLAAAIILFLVALVSAFNTMTEKFTRERIQQALYLDAQRTAYSILLARDIAGDNGEATVYPEMTRGLQPEIWVQDGDIKARKGSITVSLSIYGIDSYVDISGRIKGTRIQQPFVRATSGAIELGVE